MLENGVIVPYHSPWASPILLVTKKDGFCIEYRKLNAITKMDVYPLPGIDDSLDLLAGNRYFSTLNLASGYWQVRMSKESQIPVVASQLCHSDYATHQPPFNG